MVELLFFFFFFEKLTSNRCQHSIVTFLHPKARQRCEALGGPHILHYTSSAPHSHPEFSKGKKQQQLDGKDSHFLKII